MTWHSKWVKLTRKGNVPITSLDMMAQIDLQRGSSDLNPLGRGTELSKETGRLVPRKPT